MEAVGASIFVFLSAACLSLLWVTRGGRDLDLLVLLKYFLGSLLIACILLHDSVAMMFRNGEGLLLAIPLLLYVVLVLARATPKKMNMETWVGYFVPKRMAPLVTAEMTLLAIALFIWRRKRRPGIETYTSAQALAPVLIAVCALSIVEVLLLHIVLSQWSALAAWAATGLGLFTLVYMLGILKSLYLLPTELRADHLTLRLGHLKSIDVSYENVAEYRATNSKAGDQRSGMNMAFMSEPNVVLRLRRRHEVAMPGGRTRCIGWISIRMDDPESFLHALHRRLGQRAPDPAEEPALLAKPV